jgi:hypothetical protein
MRFFGCGVQVNPPVQLDPDMASIYKGLVANGCASLPPTPQCCKTLPPSALLLTACAPAVCV